MDHGVNPFRDWASVVDCGDISNTPFDKLQAIHELQRGWEAIGERKVHNTEKGNVPRIIGIGGDHTVSLPAIRALHKTWGQVAVLHFDSHLDSWDPKQLGGGLTKYSEVTHGSMFHLLHEEGLLSNDSNMHLGSRSMLFEKEYDLENDARCGFSYIRARQLDDLGVDEVVRRIVNTVGHNYVYLSIDIDVLDPGTYQLNDTMTMATFRSILANSGLTQLLHLLQEPLSQGVGHLENCCEFSVDSRRLV